MTTPLLEGLDGVEKMSKSLGNYVGVTDPPDEMFGKLMSISDTLMWRYYLLLTDLGESSVARLRSRVEPARSIPSGQSGSGSADRRRLPRRDPQLNGRWPNSNVSRRRELPSELREVAITFGAEPARALTRLLVEAGSGTSPATRAAKSSKAACDSTVSA